MSKSPLTKTDQRCLLRRVKAVLQARRNGNVKREQTAYNKLQEWCDKHGVDAGQAIEQGIDWLKKHSVAASMNGLV